MTRDGVLTNSGIQRINNAIMAAAYENTQALSRIMESTSADMKGLKSNLTTQKKFLSNMGINERAEIISKNQNFLKKADIFYRLNRLIDEKQMGKLFKVMLIKNQKNKFNIGF